MKRHFLGVFILIIFALWSLRVIFSPGMMQTHDSLWHVERVTAMVQALKNGQFPVRWTYDLDNHYGIPLFNFIYPGPYYLAAIMQLIGLGGISAIKSVIFSGYLLGGLGIYFLFAKENRFIATLAGLLYLLHPYQLVNIFALEKHRENKKSS